MNDAPRNSYDEIPYVSHAFAQTHPQWLAAIAHLFGMEPPPLAGCCVLELGCGDGSNIIPMAASMPDATFVGIDLSSRHVEIGLARIAALGLRNIEIRVGDLTNAAPSLPQSDYIIAHGLYSWVPPQVQQSILQICRDKLVRNGVAYVSYNTFPGWRMRGTVRDLMLYHVAQFDSPAVKVAQARALLDFMAQSAPGENTAFTQLLKKEVEELRTQHDSYIYHDFLETFNQPVYFHEFVERAAAHDMQYLGEAELATMLPSNFGAPIAETLRRIAPDIIRSEQFMDFLRNRQFRQTLLVHKDNALNRNIDASRMQSMHVSSVVRAVDAPVDERAAAPAQYRLATGVTLSTSTPLVKAAFALMMMRWPLTTPFDELRAAARSRLGDVPTALPDPALVAQDRRVLASELLQCVAAGLVQVHARPVVVATQVGERPVAWAVARGEATKSRRVTNLRHELVNLDEFNRHLLIRLDGTRDVATLVEEMAGLVETNALAIKHEGVEVRDPATVRSVMSKAVPESLVGLAKSGLYPAT